VILQDDGYRADVERLLAVCEERGVAVQTIKSIARRRWPADHAGPRYSWYEPVEDPAVIDRSVRWVLSHPQLFLNTSSDARLLEPTLAAVSSLGPAPSDEEMEADVAALAMRSLFNGTTLERVGPA
jgi:hypothetical protein